MWIVTYLITKQINSREGVLTVWTFLLSFQASEKSTRPKSTGVFQDEELLFSHKLQKDNDPDVDLFASTKKSMVSSKSSAESAI